MEALREFQKSLDKMYDEHIRIATVYMDETQKEIYKVGFANAVHFASTFIVEADLVFNDVKL